MPDSHFAFIRIDSSMCSTSFHCTQAVHRVSFDLPWIGRKECRHPRRYILACSKFKFFCDFNQTAIGASTLLGGNINEQKLQLKILDLDLQVYRINFSLGILTCHVSVKRRPKKL